MRFISFILLTLFLPCCINTGLQEDPEPETEYIDIGNDIRLPKVMQPFPEVTESNRLHGALTRFRTCYDVGLYDLNIEVDTENHSIKGYNEIHANAVENFSTLQIDLYADMKLDSIMYAGEALTFQRRFDAVFVDFPDIAAGTAFSFRVYYHGTPVEAENPPWDGGFVWEEDANGNPFVGVTCEGEGASLWWPNKDHPTEEPDSMRLTYTVNKGLVAVGNGRLIDQFSENDKTTFQWMVRNPINNYNATINIGNYVVFSDTLMNPSGVHDLVYYVLDYSEPVAREHFKQVPEVIHTYEKFFGEYPWWEDSYKLVESPFAGMEHQSSIAYGNGYSNTNHIDVYGSVDYLILHETAHEWWGNSVTACDGAEIWLHEGFATYAEVLYVEEKLGKLVSLDYLKRQKRRIQNSRPVVGPRDVNYWSWGDSYNKGSWMLHTLRSVIDDDALFFNMIKAFFYRYKNSVCCTEDFVNFVNGQTGKNYLAFFQQYLMDRVPPTLEYTQTDSTFEYRWTNIVEGFDMPVDILINKQEIRLSPTSEFQILPIEKNVKVEVGDEFYIGIIKK